MSLSSALPAPVNMTFDAERERGGPLRGAPEMGALVSAKVAAPPYGQRKGWIPRSEADFGDGGAFPEITVVQYPLGELQMQTFSYLNDSYMSVFFHHTGMGAPRNAGKKSNALAIKTDATGKVRYDVIARQGHGKDKIVYSNISQLLPAEVLAEDDELLLRPDDEKVAETTDATRRALEKLTNQKVSAALPVRHAEKLAPAQYIRYTPSQQGDAFNSGAKQRVIRMVEAQVDPMEPPKFKINQKIPRGPPSPPAPVTEHQLNWLNSPIKIVVSNFIIVSCFGFFHFISGVAFPISQSNRKGAKRMESSAMCFKLEECKRLHNSIR